MLIAMETVKQYYFKRLEELSIESKQLEKKSKIILIARLLSFLLIVGSFYFLGFTLIGFFLVTVVVVVFLTLVAMSVDNKNLIKFNKSLIQINQDEINAIEGKWSFDSGTEFEVSTHGFSSDLDLFVDKGVFSFLNRTSTLKAKKALAALLLNGNHNVEKFQELTIGLIDEITWTQKFRAYGENEGLEADWSKGPSSIGVNVWNKLEVVLLPMISSALIILAVLGMISIQVIFYFISISSFIIVFRQKKMNLIAASVLKNEEKAKVILKRAALISQLTINKPSFFSIEAEIVIGSMQNYLKICNLLNARNNLLINFLLNTFFGFDSYLKIIIQQWKIKFDSKIEAWEKELVSVELVICATTIKFNYPTTIHPEKCCEKGIEISGLSHPLIDYLAPVVNDFELVNQKTFYILTGPNMAGKSTYLRSIGLAIVFANAGLPVFAHSMTWSGFNLMTSMRNKDDINASSSYFYAELKRLKLIIDTVENKEDTIVLLDEILKGTNSKDKQEGSAKYLLKLKRLGAKGVIATHDLKLCELENEYFENKCFDSEISGDQLYFDYKIQKGICKNMNASFLMKKMNLIDE